MLIQACRGIKHTIEGDTVGALVGGGLGWQTVVVTTVAFNQAAPGITNRLTNTGDNLIILSAGISADDILILNVEREHTAADTYAASARVHLIRIEYTGRGVI